MFLDFLSNSFSQHARDEAIVWREQCFSYGDLEQSVAKATAQLDDWQIGTGAVVVLEADFSPVAVSMFLALLERQCIVVPLAPAQPRRDALIELAQGEFVVSLDDSDAARWWRRPISAGHPFYDHLHERRHPGLVLFSSGSTGQCKAAVHDMTLLAAKYHNRRRRLRTISFLLYDHIGGVNTMLHTLANGGTLITLNERSPDGVLAAVERHRAELLPTSPTFLNLVLLSEAYRRYDLSTLSTITYGTEPMPEATLRRFHELFPHVRLVQTYGLSELGILPSKSRSNDSLWVKLGGEGFETRVVEGVLQIKARSAMLGYLNAASPVTDDGWFITGDAVIEEDGYFKILGRKSELINVGGQKVFPAEVENVIQELDNVAEAVVYGEPNAITGQIVCARVRLLADEPPREFSRRLVAYCRDRLDRFKVPLKTEVVAGALHGDRFKRLRPHGKA